MSETSKPEGKKMHQNREEPEEIQEEGREAASDGESEQEPEGAQDLAEASPQEGPPAEAPPAGKTLPEAGEESSPPPAEGERWNGNLRRILDIEIPVTVSFGSTVRPLKEILQLTPGVVLELEKAADDPVFLKVNNKVLAKGQVVAVDGYYAIQITEIEPAADRIASLGGKP